MKIAAINGSPKGRNGITDKLLSPFLDGANEAGCEINRFYINDLRIAPCKGDQYCWEKGNGECIQNDDMRSVLPIFGNANIWIFASPLYFNGVTGPLKIFIDRLLPLGLPKTIIKNRKSHHPGRVLPDNRKIILISTCGLFEIDNFNPLVTHIKSICENTDREFAGAILRQHAWTINPMPDDIIKASFSAGKEIITDNIISDENIKTISRDLVTLEEYLKLSN